MRPEDEVALEALARLLAPLIADELAKRQQGSPTPTPARLSLDEVAARLGVATATVRRWIKRGCPHVNIGGSGRNARYRFELREVEEWLADR